jgi:hypothetical protein
VGSELHASASGLLWRNSGQPAPRWPLEQAEGYCATCGAPIREGVPTEAINNPTFSRHGDYWRFGSHVCAACAWLYGLGKAKPGNLIAYGGQVASPLIAPGERVSWGELLPVLAALPDGAPVAGVMTTDVKPRLWPETPLTTRAAFALYVHAPEYDHSGPTRFNPAAALEAMRLLVQALSRGFTKRDCHLGLLRNYAAAARDLAATVELEALLVRHRPEAHFLPALIAAQKGEAYVGDASAPAAARRQARQDGLGLL